MVFTGLFLIHIGLIKIPLKIPLFAGFLGSLISVNWGAFIWAIDRGYLLQSSLAYFLAPIFSVFFGALFLKERLSTSVKLAISLAISATALKFYGADEPAYAALIMAMSFSLYGLFKKLQKIKPFPALFFESFWGAVLALAYLGTPPSLGDYSGYQIFLLSLSGPVTIFPLILFAYATKQIPLQSVGFLNYLVPVSHLLLAVVAYGEPFTEIDAWVFGLIWCAVFVFLIGPISSRAGRKAFGTS